MNTMKKIILFYNTQRKSGYHHNQHESKLTPGTEFMKAYVLVKRLLDLKKRSTIINYD